jgi:hypothetical protein
MSLIYTHISGNITSNVRLPIYSPHPQDWASSAWHDPGELVMSGLIGLGEALIPS